MISPKPKTLSPNSLDPLGGLGIDYSSNAFGRFKVVDKEENRRDSEGLLHQTWVRVKIVVPFWGLGVRGLGFRV